MKKYLYLIKNSKIPTYIKYWLMYSSKKVQTTLQNLPLMLENTIKDTIIKITKIYGNTTQETRSGKNLANVYAFVESNILSVENNIITLANNSNSIGFYNTTITLAQLCPNLVVGSNYLLKYETTSASPSSNRIYLSGKDVAWYNNDRKTIDQEMLESTVALYGGHDETATISEFLIQLSSITDTSYEPYGVMPSPDFPSLVNNITGDVELTISNEDNTQEQNYSISLGDIELCKIGDYQDYLYKENGNWYKYGIIKKIVIDGTEDTISYNTTNNVFYLNCPDKDKGDNSKVRVMSDYFQGRYTTYSASEWATYPNNSIGSRGGTNSIGIKATQFADKSAFTIWLSTHNTTIYYVLATPVITQITDTTLINQLEAIQNIKAYEDITNISSDKEIKIDIDYIQRG